MIQFEIVMFRSYLIYMQDGRTALSIACWDGKIDVVKLLLSLGANSDIQDEVNYHKIILLLLYKMHVDNTYDMYTLTY